MYGLVQKHILEEHQGAGEANAEVLGASFLKLIPQILKAHRRRKKKVEESSDSEDSDHGMGEGTQKEEVEYVEVIGKRQRGG